MRELFKETAVFIAQGVEALAVLIIAVGAIEAAWGAIRALLARQSKRGQRRDVWLRFAVWLVLGLEFELASDIIRTAISPSWTDVGQLAAIGVIRTFLNYFLEQDLERYEPSNGAISAAEATRAS
jgi:uncharacterized membrane protein